MDITRLGKYRYKITIEPDDLDIYNIDELMVNNGETAEIKRLLSIAGAEYDIEFGDKKMYVEYYRSKHGGGEMFVSLSDGGRSEDSRKTGTNRGIKDKCITNYVFSSLSEMILFCGTLENSGYKGRSTAYYMPWKQYCLELELDTPLASEYGGKRMCREYIYIRKEYGKIICSNAVNKLKKYV